MYSTNNVCEIKDPNVKTMYIITQGNVKKERVEVKLPASTYFSLEDIDFDIFCDSEGEKCTLVFEAVLSSGINEFLLKSVRKDQI